MKLWLLLSLAAAGNSLGEGLTIPAPTLVWDEEGDDPTPDFIVSFAIDGIAIDDIVHLQFATDAGFTTDLIEVESDPLDGTDVSNLEIPYSLMSFLSDDTWYARARVERDGVFSDWSNTEEMALDSPPIMTSSATPSMDENETFVVTLTASQPSTFAIGGTDAAFFEIINDDELHFISAPDFETPLDDGANNVYDITITPTAIADSEEGAAANVAVTVQNVLEGDIELTFIDSATSTADASSYTLALDIGSSDDVVVGLLSRKSGDTNATISTVRLHAPDVATDPTGVAMSEVVQGANTTGGNASIVGIFEVERPPGQTSAEVVVTYAAAQLRAAAVSYSKTADTGTTQSTTSTASAPTATITVPVGGCSLGIACINQNTTWTPTNLSDDLDTVLESLFAITAGHNNTDEGETTFTFTPAAANIQIGAFAVWEP